MVVEEVKAVLLKVKHPVIKMLADLVTVALEDAMVVIANQRDAVPAGSPNLRDEIEGITQRFEENLAANFDELLGETNKDLNVLNYGSLSLVGEDDLEAIIAMEGMVAHARNCDLQEYIAFTTRLDSIFFGTRIDESNNPMDPEKIGDAFQEALRPIELGAKNLLTVFRNFNSNVFHGLENVLAQANAILIENGVLPNLDVAARDKALQKNKRSLPRTKTGPDDQAFSENEETTAAPVKQGPELFSLMQNLLHGGGALTGSQQTGNQQAANLPPSMVPINQLGAMSNQAAAPVGLQPGMLVGGQQVQMVMPSQLMDMLTEVQGQLLTQGSSNSAGETPINLSVIQSLGESLEKSSAEGAVRAIDAQASDVINLVALLYDAIWQDDTVAIPIKELIGRTQIPIMKVALTDATFFNIDAHPARMFLNEFAMAGLSWTKLEKLDKDPLYCKMQELVARLVSEFTDDVKLFDELLLDFSAFKQQQVDEDAEREQRILQADERKERIDDIHIYARQKITERILEEDIHPVVDEILTTYFLEFLVKLVLREGPAGKSWKSVINTIDVLLWTVQANKQQGDLERFGKVNGRLLSNLKKVLTIAGIEKEKLEPLVESLQEVQQQSFSRESEIEEPDMALDTIAEEDQEGVEEEAKANLTEKLEDLPEGDALLQEVDSFPIGIWLAFAGEQDQIIRCTLAAKIETIDKFIFVNQKGVKVVEKTRMGLARELKAGTVTIISESPLFERAMESVIGKLRETNTVAA